MGLSTATWFLCIVESYHQPWLVWLSGLCAGPQTERPLVRFPAGAHAWVAGQVSRQGRVRGIQSMYFSHVHVSHPLFLPLKINKIFFKKSSLNSTFKNSVTRADRSRVGMLSHAVSLWKAQEATQERKWVPGEGQRVLFVLWEPVLPSKPSQHRNALTAILEIGWEYRGLHFLTHYVFKMLQ